MDGRKRERCNQGCQSEKNVIENNYELKIKDYKFSEVASFLQKETFVCFERA